MKKLLVICLSFFVSFTFAQYGGPGGGGMGGGGGRDRSGGNGDQRQRPTSQESLNLDGNAPKGNSKISGVILNENGKDPVEYANIALYDAKTKKPVDGTMADEKGTFSLKKVAAGKFYIQVSFIGYKTETINDITVEKSKDVILGVVKLIGDVKSLNEVVVQGQSGLIEEKVDRLVYNAEKDLTTKGGDASDVLQKVPMLSVDLDGNVSLRGSNKLRVLINNKPSTIIASNIADALKMIPADLIKSVEVITSPSARYEAEGSGGIINIITKKSSLQGLNLNLDAGAGLRGSNLGLSGNFRKGKLGINIGGHGRASYSPSSTASEQLIKTTNIQTNQTQEGRSFMMFGRYNIGMDYEISKKQSLSAGVSFGTRNMNRFQLLTSNSFTNGVPSSNTTRDVDVFDNSYNTDYNLDYIRTFKPGQEWSVSALYSNSNLINNFNADIFGSTNEIVSRQKNINNNTNSEATLQTDYVHPIGKNSNFEMGIKAIMRGVNSNYEYLRGQNTQEYVPDAVNPAGFLDYDQNVYAGYGSYMFRTKNKYNFKIGVRYEYTEIGGKDQKNDIVIPAYDNLVPSINISKTIKASTYKLAYNKRLQRPGLQQLNPNVNLANPLNINYGNPELNPEFTDNLEFSLSKSIKKTYINLAFFGRQSNNTISRISKPSVTRPGAFETTWQNIGKEQALGINTYGNVFFSSKVTLNGGINVYYKYLEGKQPNLQNVLENISNDGIVIGGRMQMNLKLKQSWSAQFGGGYRGNEINLQGWEGGFGMYSAGVRKDVGKKYSFGLGADNFFGGIRVRSETDSPTLSQSSTRFMYNSNVRFTLSYKIGNMRFVEQKKRVKNDDVKEGGSDN